LDDDSIWEKLKLFSTQNVIAVLPELFPILFPRIIIIIIIIAEKPEPREHIISKLYSTHHHSSLHLRFFLMHMIMYMPKLDKLLRPVPQLNENHSKVAIIC